MSILDSFKRSFQIKQNTKNTNCQWILIIKINHKKFSFKNDITKENHKKQMFRVKHFMAFVNKNDGLRFVRFSKFETLMLTNIIIMRTKSNRNNKRIAHFHFKDIKKLYKPQYVTCILNEPFNSFSILTEHTHTHKSSS